MKDALERAFSLLEKATLLEKEDGNNSNNNNSNSHSKNSSTTNNTTNNNNNNNNGTRQRIEAATKYYEACHLLRQIVRVEFPDPHERSSSPVAILLQTKIDAYTKRAQKLCFFEGGGSSNSNRTRPAEAEAEPFVVTIDPGTNDDVSVLTMVQHGSTHDHTTQTPLSRPLVAAAARARAPATATATTPGIQRYLHIANAKLVQALGLDQQQQQHQQQQQQQPDSDYEVTRAAAHQSYLDAADAYLSAMRLSEERLVSFSPCSEDFVVQNLTMALDRVEALRQQQREGTIQPTEATTPTTAPHKENVGSRKSKSKWTTLKAKIM